MIPIQAVLFDYGMVLSGLPDPAAWAHMRTISGLSEHLLHREYWAYRHAYDRGDLIAHAYWNKVAAGANITFTPAQIHQLIAADVEFWGQLNSPMIDWAQRLQRSGIRIGILSNMPDAMAAGLLAKHGDWVNKFDHHTWSYALNLAKPEPAIYHHAVEGLGTPPDQILFIDDRADNIEAALAAGMQAIQYTDHSTFEREMQARGLTSLLQLQRSADSQNGKL
jgi:putative hydrolase of the HAD superfamily